MHVCLCAYLCVHVFIHVLQLWLCSVVSWSLLAWFISSWTCQLGPPSQPLFHRQILSLCISLFFKHSMKKTNIIITISQTFTRPFSFENLANKVCPSLHLHHLNASCSSTGFNREFAGVSLTYKHVVFFSPLKGLMDNWQGIWNH